MVRGRPKRLRGLCARTDAGDLGRDPKDVAADCSPVWLPELVERIAAQLPGNEVACTLRLVDRAGAEQFRDRNAVKLSQPSPRTAFAAHWLAPGACRSLKLERRRDLLRMTAAAGDVPNLAVAVEAAGLVLAAWVPGAAAKAGRLEACQWLCEPGRMPRSANWRRTVLERGAAGGHRHVCEWALRAPGGRRTVWTPEAVLAAARGGHLGLMDWLLLVRPEDCQAPQWDEVREAAVQGCGLAAFEQLCWRRGSLRYLADWEEQGLLLFAAGVSRTPDWRAKCDWLVSHGCSLNSPDLAYEWACELPGEAALERFAFLEEQGYPAAEHANLAAAVKAGNTAAVRYLLSRGVRKEIEDTVWSDAYDRKLEVLKELHAHGVRLDPRRLAAAACQDGEVPVMEWLLGAFGDEAARAIQSRGSTLLGLAVWASNYDLVRWLLDRGCEWDGAEWFAAAVSGCEAGLELLLELERPLPTDGMCYAEAARNGDLGLMRALRGLGIPFGPASGEAFASAVWSKADKDGPPLEALQWLLEAGLPFNKGRAMLAAITAERARGQPDPDTGKVDQDDLGEARAVREWLEQQKRPRRPPRAWDE